MTTPTRAPRPSWQHTTTLGWPRGRWGRGATCCVLSAVHIDCLEAYLIWQCVPEWAHGLHCCRSKPGPLRSLLHASSRLAHILRFQVQGEKRSTLDLGLRCLKQTMAPCTRHVGLPQQSADDREWGQQLLITVPLFCLFFSGGADQAGEGGVPH